MSERNNPVRYLKNIGDRLENPNVYNANTRKSNLKRLSDYISRTRKRSVKKTGGPTVAKRLAIAERLEERLRALVSDDENESMEDWTTLSPMNSNNELWSPKEIGESAILSNTRDTNLYVSPATPEIHMIEEKHRKKADDDKPKVPSSECAGGMLYDPCTGNPIPGNDVSILEQRVKELKRTMFHELDESKKFPTDKIKTRLDLLLYVLNRGKEPDESLLEFNNSGQLYESYWDIVFAFNLMNEFPKTDDFYLYGSKIETLVNIDDSNFSNAPLDYLHSHDIMEGSSRGASDITFVYKRHAHIPKLDTCLADSDVIPSDSCRESRKEHTAERRPLFYFCSSKYFKSDVSKGIDKFDIQNIYTAAKQLISQYDKKIVLLVRDREAVEGKIRKALRKYIADEASYVFGIKDLIAALTKFYAFVKSQTADAITEKTLRQIYRQGKVKPLLELRLHQHMAVDKISRQIKQFKGTGDNNKFLVGIVPRGGKTYIAGGIINELRPNRVVVLLGAKSETLVQFKNDLFELFANFNEYTCVDVVNEDVNVEIHPDKKYIFIMSVELFKDHSNTRKLLKELKGGERMADLFICDEAHLKQTTRRAAQAMAIGTEVDEEFVPESAENEQLEQIDKTISKRIPVVYMTGTYRKPMTVFNIPSSNSFIWEYQDIQNAKDLSSNDGYFRETFGELYLNALEKCLKNNEMIESISSVYRKFPELHLITTQFTDDAKAAFVQQNEGGFPTISHLFEVRDGFNPSTVDPATWYTGFNNFRGMARLVNYLSPSNTIQQIQGDSVYADGKQIQSSGLRSVDSIAQRMGDRLAFFTSEFITHTQLWFLPKMQGHLLYKRMAALAGVIFQSPWFRKHFHVLAVSSSIRWNIPGSANGRIKIRVGDSCGVFSWVCPGAKSLKECILDEEAYARSMGKGLIVLAQNMLHLGISLPCVDIVVLLDNGDNIDERIQKMYRALTESTNKKAGFIIDMNYFRTVHAIMEYQMTIEHARTGRKPVIYTQGNYLNDTFYNALNIYSVDMDKSIYAAKDEMEKGNSQIQKVTIPELQKIYSRKESNSDFVMKEAANVLNSNIDEAMGTEYKTLFDSFISKYKEEQAAKRKFRDEGRNVRAAKRGHPEANDNGTNESGGSSNLPEFVKGTEEQKRKAYLEIFKTVLKLGAFGTESMDVKTLIAQIKSDTAFKDLIYDTLIKRQLVVDYPNGDDSDYTKDAFLEIFFETIVIPGLEHFVGQKKNVSYSRMKEGFEDESRYPVHVQEVLEYIRDHLAPKDAERHKFGEVFTPMTLVHEMLDTLPDNVWNNPDLKWLDPANGMGNYPIAVFLRLYYGFRTKNGAFVGITEGGEGKYNPGLTHIMSNDVERRNHIVKNMLFMVELNSKNIAISRTLFKKLAPGVEPNIIQMHRTNGFLADVEMKFPNGVVNEFDIVMGNPPFNRGAVRVAMVTSKTRKERKELGLEKASESGFWGKFVEKALHGLLKNNGYLLFIHPITWFKPDRAGLHDKILSKKLHTIKIYKNDGSAQKLFEGKGKISVAFYLLQNVKNSGTTKILYGDYLNKVENVELNTKSILLLQFNSIYDKIIKKVKLLGESNDLKHKTTKSCDNDGTYKLITALEEKGTIKYVHSSTAHPDQATPKIIVGGTYKPIVLFDKEGRYGLYEKGQRHYIVGENLDKLNDYFKTKLSTMLLKSIKYEQDFIKPGYFPDVRSIDLETINDDTLADYFGFTPEERIEIAKMPDPIHPKMDTIVKITCVQLKGEDSKKATNERRVTRKKKRAL